jgi:hypothetical protein
MDKLLSVNKLREIEGFAKSEIGLLQRGWKSKPSFCTELTQFSHPAITPKAWVDGVIAIALQFKTDAYSLLRHSSAQRAEIERLTKERDIPFKLEDDILGRKIVTATEDASYA